MSCELKYSLLFVIYLQIVSIGITAGSFQNHCSKSSTCTILTKCTPYMSLVESLGKPLRPSVVEFLRAQQCGFQDNYPKVCCSTLPKNLRILKNARPKKINMLAAGSDRKIIKTTVKPTRRTTAKVNLMAINNHIVMSEFFDMISSYDMLRKKRGSEQSDFGDIEIR